MFIKHYEAARDIARSGVFKQQWSKIHSAFETLHNDEDIHYTIPTSTYCLITRKYCEEVLAQYKFIAFTVAWFPGEMDEEVAAIIGAREAILDQGEEQWSSYSPGFSKCKPGQDANEEDAGDDNPLLTWMTQVVRTFFSNVLFENIQVVDTNEGRNFVLTFCRTIGPPLVQCKLDEDWQLEILTPITKTVQMMSAVLDPVPRTLGSSSDDVWFCCTEPSDTRKRRRKTDLGESAVAEEAKVFIVEFRSNPTWITLLTDYAEAAPAEETHGPSFLEHTSEIRAAKDALFKVEVEAWKDVLADKVKPALTTYEKKASQWREHFRQGAMDDLDKDVSELLAKMHSLMEQTGGTDAEKERIQQLAHTCGAGALAQKIHMEQVHQKEESAKKQLLDMAAIDLNTFESITELKKCLRNLQNQTKDQEVRTFMMDLYNKVPPAVCKFVVGDISAVPPAVSNSEHLIKEACGLAKAICNDTGFMDGIVREKKVMVEEVNAIERLASTFVALKLRNTSVAAILGGGITREVIYNMQKELKAVKVVTQKPPKISEGPYQRAAEMMLSDITDHIEICRKTFEAGAEAIVSDTLNNLCTTVDEMKPYAGGKSDGQSWKAELNTWEELVTGWDTHLSNFKDQAEVLEANLEKLREASRDSFMPCCSLFLPSLHVEISEAFTLFCWLVLMTFYCFCSGESMHTWRPRDFQGDTRPRMAKQHRQQIKDGRPAEKSNQNAAACRHDQIGMAIHECSHQGWCRGSSCNARHQGCREGLLAEVQVDAPGKCAQGNPRKTQGNRGQGEGFKKEFPGRR